MDEITDATVLWSRHVFFRQKVEGANCSAHSAQRMGPDMGVCDGVDEHWRPGKYAIIPFETMATDWTVKAAKIKPFVGTLAA
jgi:hypothetical protein